MRAEVRTEGSNEEVELLDSPVTPNYRNNQRPTMKARPLLQFTPSRIAL
jgi:hypothetical protein